jgi:predicted kinase
VAVVVHPPLGLVLARNAGRGHPVPEEVVRRQYRQVAGALGGLTAEGFRHVIMAGPDGWPFDLGS